MLLEERVVVFQRTFRNDEKQTTKKKTCCNATFRRFFICDLPREKVDLVLTNFFHFFADLDES